MEEYYALTNKIYEYQSNEWEYAVMAAIATFNLPYVSKDNKKSNIKTRKVSKEMIVDALNVNINRHKRKQNIDKVDLALTSLCEKGIIEVAVTEHKGSNKKYQFTQVVNEKGSFQGFAFIYCDEIERMFDIEKDSDRIKSIACYVSIIQRFFREVEVKNKASFNWVKQYERHINFETIESIGRKYGRDRRSVIRSLEILKDAQVLEVVKVKLSTKEEKYLISRYVDKSVLNSYIHEKISCGDYLSKIF